MLISFSVHLQTTQRPIKSQQLGTHLRRLGGADARRRVRDLDVELGSALDDLLTLASRDGGTDLGSVGAVVHQQQLQVLNVLDAELVEA